MGYMNRRAVLALLLTLWCGLAWAQFDDADALKGVKQGKGVVALTTGNPQHLAGALKVIEKTHEGMKKQGVEPDLVLVFMGGAIPYLTRDRKGLPFNELAVANGIHEQIKKLHSMGMKTEVCSIALHGRGVAPDNVIEPLKVVGNGFISVIGYQRQGYALLPIP